MEDITFLEECGIAVDSRWLVEIMCQQASEEVCNYVNGLIRIADMLGPNVPTP
jgi:hypothetical protein